MSFRGEKRSGLRGYVRINRLAVQTPLGAQLGLVTQPLDEATGDLWVEMRMLICSDLKGSDE